MEQQTPIPPQIKDEGAPRAKTRHFPILDLGGRGGLGFLFILSKTVATPIVNVGFKVEPWRRFIGTSPYSVYFIIQAHGPLYNFGQAINRRFGQAGQRCGCDSIVQWVTASVN